jgi:hypothetical protein
MPTELWEQVPRRPRYGVNCADGLKAQVERSHGEPVPVQLEDLSRMGFQVQGPVSLTIGEAIRLQLQIEGQDLAMTLPATVQWQRSTDDDAWLAGCLCDGPVDWESLGELFRRGILSHDAP